MPHITMLVRTSCLSAGVLLLSSFNSQEHKIVADAGASRVRIPASVVFPSGVRIQKEFNYLAPWKGAKMTAVGFDTNDERDYNNKKRGVQDNCYWYNYGQADFNMKNWIETDKSLWPASLMNIESVVGSRREAYSFGDLVAIYGDYRRIVYADDQGSCYLTNDGTDQVKFSGNTYGSYCPPTMGVGEYLHKIAYGLCPPYGVVGNFSANTAKDNQYDEAGWWGDEMLRLANVNENHFSKVAVAWYIGMHRMALLAAQKAVNDPRFWTAALHYEAAALHSLTDLFSLGHAVTNRDECSFGAIKAKDLQNNPTYLFMESVIKMGGGKREPNGLLNLSTDLRPASYQKTGRNDFMPSYLGTWSLWGKGEHDYHDHFNSAGATVRNFNKDKFQVYGDYKLHELDGASRRVIENAVTASLQSLFDYYDGLKTGSKTAAQLEAKDQHGTLFAALRYVPVFIDQDKSNYFNGMWTVYADAVKDILGMGAMPSGWDKCRVPMLSGKDYFWPTTRATPCASF